MVNRISSDGHEIGCHYHFHDLMFDQPIKEIENNLQLAIDAIGNAAGEAPLGFRAPAFSISRERPEVYELLSKYFQYDSSFVLYERDLEDDSTFNVEPFSLKTMKEFPIIPKTYFNKINIKSGGTFFRLFSANTIKAVMKTNVSMGYTPLIYLHPYDYLHELEFKVEYENFKSAGFIDGAKRFLRQSQWLQLNNKSTLSKLKKISKEFQHIGPMKLALSQSA